MNDQLVKTDVDDVLNDLLAWLDGDEHALDGWPVPAESEHGPVIGYRQDAYNDITVFADSFEERFYIGD